MLRNDILFLFRSSSVELALSQGRDFLLPLSLGRSFCSPLDYIYIIPQVCGFVKGFLKNFSKIFLRYYSRCYLIAFGSHRRNEEIFFEVLTHPRPLTTIILYHRAQQMSIGFGKIICTKFRQILVRKLCNLHKNAQIGPAAAAVGPIRKKTRVLIHPQQLYQFPHYRRNSQTVLWLNLR